MNTLHMLPAPSQGEQADLVLNQKAADNLGELLKQAKQDGYAKGEFYQRDGSRYELNIEIIEGSHSHANWREVRLSYMHHSRHRILIDRSGRWYDAELLAADLIAARKGQGHRQSDTATVLGTSTAFISNVENTKNIPKPTNFAKLCSYIGSELTSYALGSLNDD